MHAVVLAAGLSSRLAPDHKLLRRLDGRTVIARTLGLLGEARIGSIGLVLGHLSEEIGRAAAASGVAFAPVRVPDPAAGMATSLAHGIAAAPPGLGAVLVVLGDMPLVRVGTLAMLLERFGQLDAGARTIVRPLCRGMPGNPVLWGRAHAGSLGGLTGDGGGRALLATAGADLVTLETGDEGVLLDLDDEDAFSRARALLSHRRATDGMMVR